MDMAEEQQIIDILIWNWDKNLISITCGTGTTPKTRLK